MTKLEKLNLKGEMINLIIKYQESFSKFMRSEIEFSQVVNVSKELDKILEIN